MKANKTILFFIFLISSFASYGQYNAFYIPKDKNEFKDHTLYVTLGDQNTDASKPYKDAIKNAWPNSKVAFISNDEVKDHTSEKALFLCLETSITSTTTVAPAGKSGGLTWNNTYFFLTLWKMGVDKKGNPKSQPLVKISLFADYETGENPNLILGPNVDYSKQGHIRNWSPGFVKNYIQTMLIIFEGGGVKLDGYRDKTELDKLNTETLYIPDYTFINFDKWTGDETKRLEVADIMKDYDLAYKVVTTPELSQKIMDTQNPIYYLVYVKNSTTKYITVMNSVTGKIVYAYGDMAGNYNIKRADLKDVAKAIKK